MTTYSLWVGNGYIDHNRNTTQGREDVATCKNLIGNRCYIQYHGGQMEQVLEEGVSISYFSSLDKAKAAVDELHKDGIKGSISINIEETEGNPQELEIIPPVITEPTTEEEPAEIDPAELLEDLDTGNHGDRLNDYRDSSSYICDAISEIADCNTSIYYSDILNFIRENPEALADVVAEGLYTVGHGEEYDLYKHGQAAEYMTIERDIYNHMRDAVLLCAVDFIRYDLKRETIPEELADLLQEWADKADNNDRMNEIPDKIREYFGNAEESEG